MFLVFATWSVAGLYDYSVFAGLCHQDAVHITAILGESVVFNCHVEFPGDHPVPYVLQWEKKVGETVGLELCSTSLVRT
jgi:hypothetical protein